MKKAEIFLITILLASLAWGPALFAADKGSQFGLMYGLSVPDADNTNMFRVFGLKGEAFIVPQFSAGGYYLQSDHSGEVSSTQKFRYNLAGVQAAYHINSAQGDTFVAFRMGMTKSQQSPGGTDVTFSPYHYGITTGYDYFLTDSFSIGFEGSYLHVLPSRSTVNGTDYNSDSFNLINFLITIQLRL